MRHIDANRASTALGISVMTVALALPALMYTLVENQRALVENWGGEPSLTAFLHRGLDTAEAERLMRQIAGDSRVLRVRFIHRDDAYAEFAASSGHSDLAADEVNPLPHVLVLVPNEAAWEHDRARGLIESLESNASIDSLLADFAWIDRLVKIGHLAERAVFMLAILLAGGALLIVGNTIRVLVHQHHDEVEVQKLVGATDAFIRRPFLYGGAIHGSLAGGAAVLLVQGIFAALEDPIARVSEAYLSGFAFSGMSATQAAVLVGFSCGLGWLGAWLGIALSLRRLEPAD